MPKNAGTFAIALILILAPLGLAQADEAAGGAINVPSGSSESSVTAPPPAHVNLKSTSIAAGLGVSWGNGTLSFEGNRYDFSLTGLSLGEFGAATIVAGGGVANLQNVSDFEGTYVAVEAGAALVKGASTMTMRNSKGVTLTLEAENQGVQLSLAAKGIIVTLR